MPEIDAMHAFNSQLLLFEEILQLCTGMPTVIKHKIDSGEFKVEQLINIRRKAHFQEIVFVCPAAKVLLCWEK